ncbi:MAG: undecaprenyl/decaprenyl-phosphate alpha-N-acetylglucosaminyl 1-phosphate transferase [Planctomycetes bacterium]|nr:undecaprenyl/decaprenyl-phosphate alpha-N-acetylglucosaminyl 1-phosphate transferase [Planctomycetota bacterium]
MGLSTAAYFAAVCFLPALVTSAVTTALMRRLAPKWGLVDHPEKRKVHTTPTPLGGGIGIWLGVVLPVGAAHLSVWLIRLGESTPDWIPEEIAVHFDGVLYRSGQMWAILAAGTLLACMGLLDDLKNIPWQPRLLIQCFVAIALVTGGVRATVFAPQPWIGMVMSVLWILVLINAFNFLDNMDGLSSGTAMIASLLFAVIMLASTSEPHWLVGGALLVLAGSLGGFLFFHNWAPARIFMGDSGSYFIGLLLACLTILGTFYEESSQMSRHVILAPLCILAVPLYDFCSVVLIRLSQRRSPFQPDKSHFSHRLVEIGMQPRYAVLTIYLATATTGLGALLLYQVAGWPGALLVVALIVCVLAIIAILETAVRFKG